MELGRLAALHRALGDETRLAIAQHLLTGDASPKELTDVLGVPSNLMAHHVGTLLAAGVVRRLRSQGDGRRHYLTLAADPVVARLVAPGSEPRPDARRLAFVCTRNSARSQLAAAQWNHRWGGAVPAVSAGTHPTDRVHPRAVAAARRHGLVIDPTATSLAEEVLAPDDLVVAVCDLAHEELPPALRRLHWAVADPVPSDDDAAFDAAYDDLAARLERLHRHLERTVMTASTRTWESIHLDQRIALRSAAARLADAFSGVYGPETIERFLLSSFDQFASRSTISRFLPTLAERFARQRLTALARIEGHHHDGRPVVLFLCTHNAGRSQMAMGFLQHLAGDRAIAWSGGSEPGVEVNRAAVAAMAERGIDISHEFPKPWTDETVRAADVVVTMGCGDACPVFPGTRYEAWELDDPAGLALADVRPIRDDLERRVRRLLDDLGVRVG